jgi:hypothetical protein
VVVWCDTQRSCVLKRTSRKARHTVLCVTELITRGRLRWFGHVERKNDSDWVKAFQKFEVIGKTGRGRNRKTWMECINKDLKDKRFNTIQYNTIWLNVIFIPIQDVDDAQHQQCHHPLNMITLSAIERKVKKRPTIIHKISPIIRRN